MKASSNLLMRAAAMLLAVSACVALSACTKLPNSSQPTPETAPTATAEPSPSPSPSPTPAPILTEDQLNEYYGNTMGFEEYMAEERIYGLSGLEIDDGYTIEPANNNTLVKREYFGYYDNANHYGDTVASYTFDEYQQIKLDFFEDITYLLADKKTILRIDRNLEHVQVLFTSDKEIERMAVKKDVLFLTFPDKSFYLYHINSKTLHFMYQNEKAWGYMPYSNYKLYADIFTDYAYNLILNNIDGPPKPIDEVQNRFLYDTKTKELTFVPLDYSSSK